MAVLFVILVIIEIHGHLFEVFTLVAEIHDNADLGILDLRSLGYYKIKQGVLQQNPRKFYHLESIEKMGEEFNAMFNERKKEEEKR